MFVGVSSDDPHEDPKFFFSILYHISDLLTYDNLFYFLNMGSMVIGVAENA